jgi:hypothetical protein
MRGRGMEIEIEILQIIYKGASARLQPISFK